MFNFFDLNKEDVVGENEIGKEQTKKVYFLSLLKEGKNGIGIDGVCDGEDVTLFIFKHTNNKFYYICPQKFVKPDEFNEKIKKLHPKEYIEDIKENAAGLYKSKNGKDIDHSELEKFQKSLMEYKPKEFDDLLPFVKKEFSKLINSNSYFIKVDKLESSTTYKDEEVIYNKSRLKMKLFLNDGNKLMYNEAPSYMEKVNSYKLLKINDIKNIPLSVEFIKQCSNDFEVDEKSTDSYVIHRETPEDERYEILSNDEVNEFYYESDENDRILIKKEGNKLMCFLTDDGEPKLCQFDNRGFLKVLIE